ncbi:CAP-Gly domain-containing linker protein 4 isoform X3 [Amia ocellicauda]|uniref:CAP-Gly domain-containing linker protein 4 isoform X3 n=1 Tax=Amia ocellicauda TaxID=2972642 RepID=UPI003463C0B5
MEDSPDASPIPLSPSNSCEQEMTREDVRELSSEGDSALGRASSPVPGSDRPVVHQVASAPMPSDCEFSFFDPNEPKCRAILLDPQTSVSELFAVLRQWVPQVQQNISLIGNEILKRGCGVNDRDGLTDMSLLHYTCKAGAPGIGDAEVAASFARQLLSLGAEPGLRSRWTNMSPLHYAAYFDVPPLITTVLLAAQPGEVDVTCSDFDFGTALHIAASNLCVSAVRCLLQHGANPAFRNECGQCPVDVVPEPLDMPLEMADAAAQAKELRQLLREALPQPASLPLLPSPRRPHRSPRTNQNTPDSSSSRGLLASLGLRLGDRVIIAGQKVGTLRFCGATEFSGGQWAGVELEDPEGKNDGSVGGVQYFTCRPKHGIFAPVSKVTRVGEWRRTMVRSSTPLRGGRPDLSHITARVNTGSPSFLGSSRSSSSSSLDSRQPSSVRLRPSPRARPPARPRRERAPSSAKAAAPGARTPAGPRMRRPSVSSAVSVGEEGEVQLGERVLVAGQRTGLVQFCGNTSFAPGLWLGIELDKPSGKNDGSVGGVQYFKCPPKHGVFAPPSRVQRIHGSLDSLTDLSSARLNHSFPGIRRSFSTSSTLSAHRDLSRRSPVNRSRPAGLRRSWSTASAGSPGVAHFSGTPTPWSSDGGVKLHLGMTVLLSSANEMGVVRYLGPADFAPGLWVGLELRGAKGKNDGSVGERRYFSCRPGHGVLVRPSRVTYRGINGAKLVEEGS